MECCICNHPIPPEGPKGEWKQGHNAEPVMSGRCCGECNAQHVVPVRIKRMYAARAEEQAAADG